MKVDLANLAVDLGGLVMRNPVCVASGTFGSGQEYAQLWNNSTGNSASDSARNKTNKSDNCSAVAYSLSDLGALTTKGVSLQAWPGNDGVRIAETSSGMLNSIGLQNAGVESFCKDDLAWLALQDVPVIVNVVGHTYQEYAIVIERLESEPAVAAYEVNISCPNVDAGGITFGIDPIAAAEVTGTCRKVTRRPLIVKLTPNVTDIGEIARAVEAAGADAISLINTVAGMAIDVASRSSVFVRGVAGLSGPAIKPIALYAVHQVAGVVKLPLLGMGGISSLNDVLEFMLAGATAVAIGSMNFSDPLLAPRLVTELQNWCEQEGINDIREIIGALR